MMGKRGEDDFRNVVWVPRFHQAPQRIQHASAGAGDNIVILPVIRIEREPPRSRKKKLPGVFT